ncbi:hypothetical protein Tco_1052822 [Tanacetum coccineum]
MTKENKSKWLILKQNHPQSRSSRHIFQTYLNQTSTAKEIWDNVEMLMQGSGRTLQQRKEDLFDEYERFRAIGNESIHDYFVRFHKLVNDMKITQLEIPTHQMMSDHNSSDLAPQRQEMSVENVASGLVPQGQKASDYDNSDPVPPRQNVVPSAEKTDSSQQGLEFLFSPLLEEYYNPTHGNALENNNDQAPNASFQEDEFINPFCTRVQEIGESSSRNIDNTDVHSFQPQSHDYRWTRDHPLEQVRGNPTMPVQTRRQLATDPEMCMFALTVSIVEPKNIKEAMADSAWIEAMQDELH